MDGFKKIPSPITTVTPPTKDIPLNPTPTQVTTPKLPPPARGASGVAETRETPGSTPAETPDHFSESTVAKEMASFKATAFQTQTPSTAYQTNRAAVAASFAATTTHVSADPGQRMQSALIAVKKTLEQIKHLEKLPIVNQPLKEMGPKVITTTMDRAIWMAAMQNQERVIEMLKPYLDECGRYQGPTEPFGPFGGNYGMSGLAQMMASLLPPASGEDCGEPESEAERIAVLQQILAKSAEMAQAMFRIEAGRGNVQGGKATHLR